MHFAIDIDQTICGSNAYEIYAAFHNTDLDLQIDPRILSQLTSYRDFLLLPEVVAFRLNHEREWNLSRHRAIATPDVLIAFVPIEGAVQGIEHLSTIGEIWYYTARTPDVREVTQSWLKRYRFPHNQDVACCTSIDQKVMALAQRQDDEIVLIDDRGHTHFLAALEKQQGEITVQELLHHLTIFAFGASTLPTTSLCPLITLPNWGCIQSVLSSTGFLEQLL